MFFTGIYASMKTFNSKSFHHTVLKLWWNKIVNVLHTKKKMAQELKYSLGKYKQFF